MTTLVIGDLHLKHEQAEKIISCVCADQIVFTLDLFDDFGDTVEMNIESAKWLNESCKRENRIHLTANHDLHYIYGYPQLKCSGYTDLKNDAINEVLTHETKTKLKFYHVLEGNWLATHAGLTRSIVPKLIYEKGMDEITSWLDYKIDKDFELMREGQSPCILGAGHARGGRNRAGGITWCDFNSEFQPINKINQIFGHTPLEGGPKQIKTGQSHNICIDVWGNLSYAIIEGKDVKFGSFKEL